MWCCNFCHTSNTSTQKISAKSGSRDKYLPLQISAFLTLVYQVLYFSVVSILLRRSDHRHCNLHPTTSVLQEKSFRWDQGKQKVKSYYKLLIKRINKALLCLDLWCKHYDILHHLQHYLQIQTDLRLPFSTRGAPTDGNSPIFVRRL